MRLMTTHLSLFSSNLHQFKRSLLWGCLSIYLLGLCSTPCSAEDPTPTTSSADTETQPDADADRYEFRAEHDPNGIGKFYQGREIAHVMGFGAAPWLERPEREEEEKLTQLIEALQLKPGMVAADVGAGSGRISLMMAEQVGPTGKVIAVDIQQEMLDLLSEKLSRLKIENVTLLLGTARSPKLPAAELDLVLMVDVYHELEFPYEMMRNMADSLQPGGRIVLVEYRREDPQVPIKLIHKMTQAQVRKELELPEFGLTWKETIDVLPWQHIIVFEKQGDATP